MPVLRQQRPTLRVVLLLSALLACVIFLVVSYFEWSPTRAQGKKTYKLPQPDGLDLLQYPDVDDYINEDEIRQVFLTPSQATVYDTSGLRHSLDELQELISTIDTSTLPPVTVIVPYHSSIDALKSQLAALNTQSVAPYSIWIICATEDGKHFVEQQNFLYSNIEILFRDKMMPFPSTEYTWVLDQGVLPGPRHLELLLKLDKTPEYRNTFVGVASNVRVGRTKNKLECHPVTTTSETTTTTQMLSSAWLLRRHWLHAAALNSRPDNVPLGYWISRNFGAGGQGIPLISLPAATEKNKDYVLKGVSDNDECVMLIDYFKNINSLGIKDEIMVTEEDAPTATETVVFLVDEDNMDNAWVQLACSMHSNPKDISPTIHIATTSDTIKCPSFPSYRVHHINTRVQWIGNDLDDVYLAELVQQFIQLFTTVDARVIIYMQDGGVLHHAADIARSIVGDAAVMIGLPRESLPHMTWLTDLPVSALSQWHSISIKLVLTSEDSNTESFNRLYNSIQKAQLLNDNVDLMVYMERNLKDRTQRLVQDIVWAHGAKDIRHRIVPSERALMFVEAWYPATDDEYAIILDDGMEVSPLFYIWAKYAILKYRYAMPREDHLYGISLSTPRILDTAEETHQRFTPPSEDSHTPFLMQTPVSLGGGAIYFPEHWREFHDYMNARVADHLGFQLQEVEVPELKSRQWTHSWRRYMDELVYLRGNVMLYHNFGDHASFATRKKLPGHHKAKDTALSTSVLPFFSNPLLTSSFTDALPDRHLPEFNQLQILDIWGKPVSSLDVLVKRGRDFQKTVSACTPSEEYLFDPSELLCPFAHVVQVPDEGKKEPLPTKTITLYLPAHPTM